MSSGKWRQVVIAAVCGLLLWAIKVYQEPTAAASKPEVQGWQSHKKQPSASQPSAQAGEAPGRFDYYVLSLSWSPEYCASHARPDDRQCQRPYAFVVHGLWPQNEHGYPEDCGQGAYLDNTLIEQMLPVMPSKPLIIHEWKKHGVCTGLSAERYFATVRRAFEGIHLPLRYQAVTDYLSTSTQALKAEFVAANASLTADSLSLQCSGQYLQEVRVCLTRDLQPRSCSADLRDRCGSQLVLRPSRG